jgi:condensin complex subunit 3
MVHEGEFLGKGSANVCSFLQYAMLLKHYLFLRQGDRIIEFLLHVLDGDDSDKVQALICMGLAKLMLAGMASEDRVSWYGVMGASRLMRILLLQVLISLIVSYLSPDTADNQELRQCLAYFFPVYCYSSPVNQRRMQKVRLMSYRSP